jgi:hypothetical protein
MKKILFLQLMRLAFFIFCTFIPTISFGQQTTLFQFNFEGITTPNINNTCGTPVIAGLGINKPSFSSDTPCAGASMLSAANWKNDEFYRIEVNTSGYEKMYFSYCNRGQSGIGNFISYLSTDNGTTKIEIVSSYTPTTTNSTITSIELPVVANNKGSIFLYVQKVGDATGSLAFLIDNITLRGTPLIGTNGGTLAGGTTVCTGTNSTVLTLSGHTGTITKWQSSPSITFASSVSDILNTSTTLIASNLAATTYYRAVVSSSACNLAYSSTGTITVRPTFTSGTINNTGQTICNTTVPSVTIGSVAAASGGDNTITYQWQYSTDNTFATGVIGIASNLATYTPTQSLTQTTYYRRQAKDATCNTTFISSANVWTVTVNALLTPPSVGIITQPNCVVPKGSVSLSGLPSSGTWTITANPATTGLTELTGSGSTTIISGLTAGTTYSFVVSNGTCTSATSVNAVINAVITTTLNGSGWTTTPDVTMIGIINSNSIIASNVDLCNCTINTGINVTVASGVTLKLQDKLTVNGTLTFEDKASLVQINNVTNTGSINYIRTTTTTVRNTDYTYWSTPVSPLNLGGTGGITYNPSRLVGSIFYSYLVTSGSENWNSESEATQMLVGKGYIIRGPVPASTSAPTFLTATFTGIPNNGDYSITGIFPDKSYLIGNPYPSALDADKFLTDNAGVLDGTLYFWTHNTAIGTGVSNPGSGVYAYSGDDYATYNRTGGTGTAAAPSDSDKSNTNPNIPTGKIAAGQGFFASSKLSITGTEIVFKNIMRVGVGGITGNNSQFFKTISTKSKTAGTIEKNRVWLNLYNSQGGFKQSLVGYVTGATNKYDSGYDGETFDGNEFLDFYSINDDVNLTIQGRALPFDKNDEVSLGYRSAIVGDFTIAIDQTDGLFATQDIFIEDKMTNTIKNLKEGVYNFSTVAGTFNNRFVLRFIQKTLGTDNFIESDNSVLISKDKNELKIKSQTENIKRITVFDLLGRKIFDKEAVNSTEFSTSNSTVNNQVVVVKVLLATGKVISQKVIY